MNMTHSLFLCSHEGGHGLYDLGLDQRISARLSEIRLTRHSSSQSPWGELLWSIPAFWISFTRPLQQTFSHQLAAWIGGILRRENVLASFIE